MWYNTSIWWFVLKKCNMVFCFLINSINIIPLLSSTIKYRSSCIKIHQRYIKKIKDTCGLPYFDSKINVYIKSFKNTNNRLPNYEEMIKVLDNTINYVNHNHRRKGLNNYQIKIENKNKYVNNLIEDKSKEEE